MSKMPKKNKNAEKCQRRTPKKNKNDKNAEIVKMDQIAETERVRYLETFKIWVFLAKQDGFFEKKLDF